MTTNYVSRITATTAFCSGEVISDGYTRIIEEGVCWGEVENPTIDLGSLTPDSGSVGLFYCHLTGLNPGTKYHLRAYAINQIGIAYGKDVEFTTKDTLASITTTSVTAITSSTALTGGSIVSDGGQEITIKGVCWNTSPNPTTGNHFTKDNNASPYLSRLSGLKPKTPYYVRAYAINNLGTAYGNEVSFVTLDTLSTVSTKIDNNMITSTTVTAMGYVISDGGASLSALGFCWSTNLHPTLEDFNILVRNGSTDPYGCRIGGLTPKTTYYIRAYVTNKVGTSYGNEIVFTTENDPLTITDIDGNEYNVVRIGSQLWMKENLKTTRYNDGSNLPSYFWYDNDIKNKDIYGALYQIFYIQIQKICPTGWHVPTKDEWSALAESLGDGAGGKMKATALWNEPNTGADNSSGFTALPGGFRGNGVYSSLGINTSWWSSTFGPFALTYWGCSVYYDKSNFTMGFRPGGEGYSIRCLRDY